MQARCRRLQLSEHECFRECKSWVLRPVESYLSDKRSFRHSLLRSGLADYVLYVPVHHAESAFPRLQRKAARRAGSKQSLAEQLKTCVP